MALVLSVDLAYRSYEDFGFCLLEESSGRITNIRYPTSKALGLSQTPEANSFASKVMDFVKNAGISVLMLDGPQGWKDPNNGLPHQRICEKYWNTQAKTGTRGNVKPAPFTSFVSFSIEVFQLLAQNDFVSLVTKPIVDVPFRRILLTETYPYSAWKSLNIDPLPGKRNPKCNPARISSISKTLEWSLHLPDVGKPSHDELSALVAGLAGVAIVTKNEARYIALGSTPKWASEGHLLEGYIVNPR